MKKRVVAGLLTTIMVLQIPFAALAAEVDLVPVKDLEAVETEETAEATETVTECMNDWRNLPYKGKIEGSLIMNDDAEAITEEPSAFCAGSGLEALNAYKYSAILPSTETVDKYGCRGDVMKLRFNLFCRGVSTDKYYVRVRKGSTKSGGKTGTIVGHTEGNFDSEECLINMTLDLNTGTMEAGTYTVETYMRYKSGSSYYVDSSTHYYFNIYITNSRTALDSISIDTTGKQMQMGEELALEVTYEPKNTTADTTVTWSNTNPVAVDVEDGYYKTQAGTLTAMDYGTSYIIAHMGNETAVCIVTVSPDADEDFSFSDVMIVKDNWKYESIKYVNERGIMNGISGTSWFEPNSQLTRAMFATVLYRMAGSPEVEYTNRFTDVEDGRYYSDAIIWASNQGIVSGMGNGTYGVNRNITREQIAKMLKEYARARGYDISQNEVLDSYTDVAEVSGWAVDYMKWATAVDMITGKPNSDGSYRLDPKGEATRAECAKMLMMFEQKYESEDGTQE